MLGAAGPFPGSATPTYSQRGPQTHGVSPIIADRDSFIGRRSGNINPLVYLLYRTAPKRYFHDITGIGQKVTNNGRFSTRPGYDLATGIGTPIMAALITETP
jgi:hypothetical protein